MFIEKLALTLQEKKEELKEKLALIEQELVDAPNEPTLKQQRDKTISDIDQLHETLELLKSDSRICK